PQIGRITALDPAGPDFYEDNPEARLDRSDAAYVDAIHTDYGNVVLEGLGLQDTVGMDDFYPNGGYRQPGCGVTKGLFNVLQSGIGEGLSKTVACNHQRSWGLFIVNPKAMDEHCQYVGYECDSWDKFREGKCGDCGAQGEQCGVFSVLGKDDPDYGNHYLQHMNVMKTIDTKKRKLYFKTDDNKPFCLHHYQIIVHLANSMPRSATGFINLSLHGSRRSVDELKFGEIAQSYGPGMKVTALGTYVKSLGTITQIDLKWTFGGLQLLDPTKLFNFPKLHVQKI
ncbi:pancreatic lipase-related protein 2-like protein, partial [Leptotrombidium deliense]